MKTPPVRPDEGMPWTEFDVLEAMDVAAADRELERWEAEEQDEADIETYLDGRE